ncbi:TIGR02234 family membrane protein [Bailinhaonella thermotolerans]|uniref:TIGR02234 family membrane protein n=1 Tax=Bailinhaonella thermotolerans TaxID=1070861 RepID=A0A3A4A6X9_9ACTN|nr:TIGR02234 family membrane protein [Bailinhaonella thermotolerans]RJL24686.1 TIGR02234 family membrane protein [Bailinhaonella thermotolerans]
MSGAPTGGASPGGAPESGAPESGAPESGASTNGASTNGASTNGASTNGTATSGTATNGESPSGAPAAAGRRSMWTGLVLIAAGAGALFGASGQVWSEVRLSAAVPGAARALTGDDLAGLVTPAAVVALAGLVALLATRGVARRGVGALIALAGVGAAVSTFRGMSEDAAERVVRDGSPLARLAQVEAVSHTAWPYLSLAGAALLLAGGLFAIVRAGSWPGMSARYDRPGSGGGERSRRTAEGSLWDAIDRGADPTADPADAPGEPGGPSKPSTEQGK